MKTYYKTSIEKLTQAVLNFPSRCNNEFKKLRKHTDLERDCPFHNAFMIETLHHQITQELPHDLAFVVTRYISNRGYHVVNELITLDKKKIGDREMVIIHMQSIGDEETKKLTGKELKSETSLKRTWAKYVLYPTDEGKIEFKYTYEMETDHWLINKIVAASNVFDNMETNITNYIKTLSLQTKTETL